MLQAIESNLGFTVLLGDPGMGKTTLLLQLLTRYRDSARTAFIFQTQCRRYELLRYLAAELELPVPRRDEVAMHQRLKEMLVNEARAGRKVLIFIDEAQNLHAPSLEALRLLSDFETPRAKLLHIILAGYTRLGEMLQAPALSQLAQRISMVSRLEPLSPEDVKAYVTFRLRVAECRAAETLFTEEALNEIAERSEGIPRLVNSLCHRSLSLAHAVAMNQVNGMLVRQAGRDLDLSHRGATDADVVPIGPRREGPNGAAFAARLAAWPENQVPHGSISSVATPKEAHRGDEIDLHPVESSVAGSDKQAQPLQLRENVRTDSRPTAGHPATVRASGNTPHNHFREAASSPNYGIRLWAGKSERWVFVALAVLLLALAGWVGWSRLRNQSALAQPVAARSATAETTDLVPLISGLLYSPSPDLEANAERKLTGTKPRAAVIQTLPQSVLPSKLHPQATTPPETEPPVAAPNIGTDLKKLSVSFSNVPVPLPAPADSNAVKAAASADRPRNEEQPANRRPVKVVQPEYPKLAQLRHIEGDVLLELRIDAKGKVQAARAISGNPLLGEAAQRAAMQWQYSPMEADAQPDFTVTRVRFNFTLNPANNR